ncbi:hypothetical protein [Rhodococcus spelaei]|uniref:hypothetical protein n=1 Tax=Rhodococcus spelaei TaxID=2546320 RepID=UPI0015EF7EF7|nr:hypothetical protein [Rhodococcus spelaei]
MADDDDTSAGLTPAKSGAATRRRASRSAGPAKDGPAVETVEQKPTASPETAATPAGAVTAKSTKVDADTDGASTAPAAAKVDLSKGEPDSDTDSDESEPAAETDTPKPPRNWRRLSLIGVVAVLVVALVAAGIVLLFDRNSANERDARRGQFDQVARQTVLNLTTIKPDTAKEDVDRILAGASGEFKSEFDGRQDPFVSVVKEAGVTTVGKIIESGVQSEDGDTARVLVAARADVSTPDNSQNGPRDFRMRVTVTDADGTMTASKVEFVP